MGMRNLALSKLPILLILTVLIDCRAFAANDTEQSLIVIEQYLRILKGKYKDDSQELNKKDRENFTILRKRLQPGKKASKKITVKEAKEMLRLEMVRLENRPKKESGREDKTVTKIDPEVERHVATIVRLHKKVDLLAQPSNKISAEGVNVKYLDKFYKYRTAKVGDKLKNGDIIRTAVNAFARVIFDNGDQINIAPGTSYKIVWGNKAKEYKTASPSIYVLYGKVRAIFENKGPRNKTRFRTANASMGIRGTDFFIDSKSYKLGSSLVVVRGKVAITNYTTKETVEVEKGYRANITIDAPRETKDLFLWSFDQQELKRLDSMVESMKISLNRASIDNLSIVRDSFRPEKFQEILERDLREQQEYLEKRREEEKLEKMRRIREEEAKIARAREKLERELERKREEEEKKMLIEKLGKKERIAAISSLEKITRKVGQLEKKAYLMVLNEIKTSSPDLYKRALAKGIKTSGELNDFILEDLIRSVR